MTFKMRLVNPLTDVSRIRKVEISFDFMKELLLPLEVSDTLGIEYEGTGDEVSIRGEYVPEYVAHIDVEIEGTSYNSVKVHRDTLAKGPPLVGVILLRKIYEYTEIVRSTKVKLPIPKSLSPIHIVGKRLKEIEEFDSHLHSKGERIPQDFLLKHLWFFGGRYTGISKEVRLGLKSRNDLLLKRIDGYHDIIELKGPSVNLFDVKEGKVVSIGRELAGAIWQLAEYLTRYEELRHFQKREAGVETLHPIGIVVIGRETNEVKKSLRILNNYLSRIRVVTYDSLMNTAKNLLRVYLELS